MRSELTAGELRKRGCYLGSNVSYNLKKLVEAGYIRHERSQVDRRSVHISVTEKGLKVAQIVNDLYDRHVLRQEVGGIDDDEFVDMNRSLKNLSVFGRTRSATSGANLTFDTQIRRTRDQVSNSQAPLELYELPVVL